MLSQRSNHCFLASLRRTFFLNPQQFPFTNKLKKEKRDRILAAKEARKKKDEEEKKYDFTYKDAAEAFEMDKKLYYDKTYLKLSNEWKKNMAKKQRAKAILKERKEHYV